MAVFFANGGKPGVFCGVLTFFSYCMLNNYTAFALVLIHNVNYVVSFLPITRGLVIQVSFGEDWVNLHAV